MVLHIKPEIFSAYKRETPPVRYDSFMTKFNINLSGRRVVTTISSTKDNKEGRRKKEERRKKEKEDSKQVM